MEQFIKDGFLEELEKNAFIGSMLRKVVSKGRNIVAKLRQKPLPKGTAEQPSLFTPRPKPRSTPSKVPSEPQQSLFSNLPKQPRRVINPVTTKELAARESSRGFGSRARRTAGRLFGRRGMQTIRAAQKRPVATTLGASTLVAAPIAASSISNKRQQNYQMYQPRY